MLTDFEQRTLDLANRLHDMTYTEWEYVRFLIDKKFKSKKKESEQLLQLSVLEKKDFF